MQEKEYFGLAVVDEAGHYTWLQLDRKVLDHDLPRKPIVLTVHFLGKFSIGKYRVKAWNANLNMNFARVYIFHGFINGHSRYKGPLCP